MSLDQRVDEVQRRIQSMVELRKGWAEPYQLSRELQRLFKVYDSDNTGTMSLSEFNAMLDKYPIGASQAEVEALFDRYDLNDNGLLSFGEFSDGLFGVKACPLATPASRNIIQDIRSVLMKRTDNNMQKLSRCLRTMDSNKSGALSQEELQRGLHRCGCEISDSDMATVMTLFDTNKDGSVSCTEFLRTIRGPLPERRKLLILQAFLCLDRNKDGSITLDELAKVYDTSQHPSVLCGRSSEEDILKELTESWDGDGNAVITIAEFTEYQRNVSASIDSDDHYELLMRNTWRIPGGEGVCENTANLRVCVTHTNGSQKIYALENSLSIKPTDTSKIKARLLKQGVESIKQIHIA